MEYFNKLYVKFPIFVESYYFQKQDLIINIINQNRENIEIIEIEFNNKKFETTVNSNERIQKIIFPNIEKSNLHSKPIFLSVTIDKKKYKLSDYSEYVVVSKPKSIFNLGLERFLYKRNIAESAKIKKKDIKYLAQEGEYFWHCTCGTCNLAGFEECTNCGNKKKSLFSVATSYEYEGMRTEKIVKIKINVLIWLFVIFFVHILIQMFSGDFLFENIAKNNFFGVFNRFLVPLLLFLTTLGELLSSRIHSKRYSFIFTIANLSLLLYLNMISAFAFILTAYNLLFLIGVNILFVVTLIYRHFNLKNKIYHHLVLGSIVVLMSLVTVQWVKYSHLDLRVEQDGINLNVSTDDKIYYVPEKINNIKVFKIFFDSKKEYNITELYIGKNIENISLASTLVLPKLEKIIVADGNKNYYVKNDLLYTNEDLIKLAPMMTKEIVINDKYIPNFAFMNNQYLETITFGANVEHIGAQAFENNYNLENIIFDSNSKIKFIEEYAFRECRSLVSIDFPVSLEMLGIGVLQGCNSLVELKAPFIGEKRENTTPTSASTDLFNFFFGSRSHVSNELIPLTLKKVEIFDIIRIHTYTFYRAFNLEEIIFPSEMIYDIGNNCFFRCESLKEFIIPNGIVSIKEKAFEQTISLENIVIPNTVTLIENHAFKDTISLKSIVIPASVTKIEKNAFLNSGIETATYLGDINNLEIVAEGNGVLISLLS